MTITYNIFNSLDSKNIMGILVPWDYRKATLGFYSRLWIDLKNGCASSVKIDKRFVKVKIIVNKNSITDRFEIVLPSGVRLNSPFDLNKIDFKIIRLHLEALELSL